MNKLIWKLLFFKKMFSSVFDCFLHSRRFLLFLLLLMMIVDFQSICLLHLFSLNDFTFKTLSLSLSLSNCFFILFSVPTDSSSNKIERVILAKFDETKASVQPVEVSYGAPEEVLTSTRVVKSFEYINQIQSDEPLVHNYLFPVMKSAPPVCFRFF